MDAFLELAELIGRLSTASSLAGVCTLLKRYAINFGMPRLSCVDLRVQTPRISEAMMWTDVSRALLRTLDRAGDFSCHAIIKRARDTRKPFEIEFTRGLGIADLIANRTIADALSERLPPTSGLAIPIQDSNKVVALVALTGQKPALNPLTQDALNVAAHAGWQRSKELSSDLPSASTAALTLREIECLAWVAKGKTDQEIARILSVAPRTVRFHVHNAKAKLNVATRIQAVTKLMRERPELHDASRDD